MPRIRPTLVALECALLFAGACSLLSARSDPTRYFVLTASAPERSVAAPSLTVGLDRVELPEYLKRPELVTRAGDNQLRIAEYEVWGEPLKDSFARTLRHDLEKDLGASVVVAPFEASARPDVVVDVDVQRFERLSGEGAVLDARWTLRDGKRGTILARREVRERQPLDKQDAQAAVAGLSRAVAALAGEVTDAVRADDRRRHEAANVPGTAGE
jgi:uncharacterized protein